MADKFNLERFKEQYEKAIQEYCDKKAHEIHVCSIDDAWKGMEYSASKDFLGVGDFLSAKYNIIRTALYKQFGIEHLL